eukprot:scaffold188_cov429-Prasinococcus_capsulatus_cf.AAC.3
MDDASRRQLRLRPMIYRWQRVHLTGEGLSTLNIAMERCGHKRVESEEPCRPALLVWGLSTNAHHVHDLGTTVNLPSMIRRLPWSAALAKRPCSLSSRVGTLLLHY